MWLRSRMIAAPVLQKRSGSLMETTLLGIPSQPGGGLIQRSLAIRPTNSGFTAPPPPDPKTMHTLPGQPGAAANGFNAQNKLGQFTETARLDRIDISPAGEAVMRKLVMGQGVQEVPLDTASDLTKELAQIRQDDARAVNGTDRGQLLTIDI